MKIIALVLAAAAAASPLRAQTAAGTPGGAAPAAKPAPSCVCDQPGFKPLTERAVAVQEYWDARRKTKISSVIGGLGLLFSMATQNPRGFRESTESYDRTRREMWRAKEKAVASGALVVRGDDFDGDIEIRLTKDVDYVIEK